MIHLADSAAEGHSQWEHSVQLPLDFVDSESVRPLGHQEPAALVADNFVAPSAAALVVGIVAWAAAAVAVAAAVVVVA